MPTKNVSAPFSDNGVTFGYIDPDDKQDKINEPIINVKIKL